MAIDKLGHAGHKFLLERVADVDAPLPLASRGQAVAALREHEPCGALIDPRRQIAQDLLQAKDAQEPCEVADQALRAIEADPDAVYLQPVADAKLPKKCKEQKAKQRDVRRTLVDLHGPPKKKSGGGRCSGLRGVFGRGC